jgi:hypothetical protein
VASVFLQAVVSLVLVRRQMRARLESMRPAASAEGPASVPA